MDAKRNNRTEYQRDPNNSLGEMAILGVRIVATYLRPITSPLAWWRLIPAADFKQSDLSTLHRSLIREDCYSLPDGIDRHRWLDAISGHAPTAIAIALTTLKRRDATVAFSDCAMTALVCTSLEGDSASAVVLAAALRRRAHLERHCTMLEQSWLAHAHNPDLLQARLISSNA